MNERLPDYAVTHANIAITATSGGQVAAGVELCRRIRTEEGRTVYEPYFVMSWIRGDLRTFQKGQGEISGNNMLSPEGKKAAEKELQQSLGVDFLKKSHTKKQEYVANLKKAIRDADGVVYANLIEMSFFRRGRHQPFMHSFSSSRL
ncbi:hypothetical protein [Paenibacillus sp. LHD-38]|uniref:hypothetical protein n=1 Tax=Paenibacillus sp. LHD-38 TaxID=3072143 RepID=UPI00280DDD26|nr:hypothetical protein [Paenibacillus sp. LHD-38]MDQ8733205.1 hypothetical protein [Paenibacillus sp. LHD-38]